MSKSQAIEGVMKIFLMIAVIIVGMSFLLKAFGIDLLGWIQELFSDVGIPKEGMFLHVALDEAHSVNIFGKAEDQLWEFHLTNGESASKYRTSIAKFFTFSESDKHLVHPTNIASQNEAFFLLDGKPEDKCILLLTDENDGKGVTDRGAVYYINPGTTIQEGCGDSLYQCISSSLSDTSNFFGCRTNILNLNKLTNGGSYDRNRCLFVNSCERSNLASFGEYCSTYNSKDNIDKCNTDKTAYKIGNYYVPTFVEPSANMFAALCAISGAPTGEENSKSINDLEKLTVLGIPFKPVIDNGEDTCSKNNVCSLLKRNSDKSYAYEVKYGLLCGGDGKWHTCKDSTKTVGDPLFKADCNWNDVTGTWVIDKKTPKIECAFPELSGSSECIFDQPSITLTGGSVWVCGKLTINGEPVPGRKLTLERFDQYNWVPVTEISNTGDDGRACLKWMPPSTDAFRNTQHRYKITFSGDNLFNPATGEERKLCIGPDLPC